MECFSFYIGEHVRVCLSLLGFCTPLHEGREGGSGCRMEMEVGANTGPLTRLKNSGEHDLPYLGHICCSLLSYVVQCYGSLDAAIGCSQAGVGKLSCSAFRGYKLA